MPTEYDWISRRIVISLDWWFPDCARMENWTMSSTTFENIFDHAAAIVRSRRGDTPDVNRLLDDFRRRAMAFEKDPLCNRELIVEPAHEAQVLELPIDLVESVAAELQNLNILHVWVRATCPSGDEETLVETDKPAEFKTAISLHNFFVIK